VEQDRKSRTYDRYDVYDTLTLALSRGPWCDAYGSVSAVKPKTRKLLIAGAALLIFGPALGWALLFAGYFHAIQSLTNTPPGTMPNMERTASQIFESLIPFLLGGICGATGLFLVVYALITHFFRPKDDR
jgi:hypothetical protein